MVRRGMKLGKRGLFLTFTKTLKVSRTKGLGDVQQIQFFDPKKDYNIRKK